MPYRFFFFNYFFCSLLRDNGIGLIPKVIRLDFFLDIVPGSLRNYSRAAWIFRRGSVYVSLRLLKAKENLQCCGEAFFDI